MYFSHFTIFVMAVMEINSPYVVARYELEVLPEHRAQFHEILDTFYEKSSAAKKAVKMPPPKVF